MVSLVIPLLLATLASAAEFTDGFHSSSSIVDPIGQVLIGLAADAGVS